jgi:hypothetical protein
MNHQWPAFNLPQVIVRLPPAARAKYSSLQAQVADSGALASLSFERQRTIEERRDGIARRLGYLDAASERDTIAELKAELDVIAAELEKLGAERAKRDGMKANAEQVLSGLNNFMGTLGIDLPNAGGLRAANVTATPNKGENLADAIGRVRSEIGDAKGELQRTKIAPPTPEEIKEQLRQHVQALVLAGTPTFTVDGGRVVVYWPDTPTLGGARGEAISAPSGSASRLLACLFPDKVFELLCAGVDDVKGGISAAARPLIVAELEDKIMELEQIEEALVTQAIAAGLEVHRRSSASGWALLGIAQPAMQAEHLHAA